MICCSKTSSKTDRSCNSRAPAKRFRKNNPAENQKRNFQPFGNTRFRNCIAEQKHNFWKSNQGMLSALQSKAFDCPNSLKKELKKARTQKHGKNLRQKAGNGDILIK